MVALALTNELPFVGTFAGKDCETFEIRKEGDHLVVIADGLTDPLMASSTYTFFATRQNSEINFFSENDQDHGKFVSGDLHANFHRVK